MPTFFIFELASSNVSIIIKVLGREDMRRALNRLDDITTPKENEAFQVLDDTA
jgi:hypothetical protein